MPGWIAYVRHVAQLLAMQDLAHALVLGRGRVLSRRVGFADGAGDDGDVKLAREGLVLRQELFRVGAGEGKLWVVGHPRREVVLWEDGEVAAGGGGFADRGCC